MLSSVVPIKAPYVLRYVDDENESIRFTTDLELEEAIRVSKGGVLRISVSQEQQQQQLAQPAGQPQQQVPQQTAQPAVDDVEFWSGLPLWLKEKIARRHRVPVDIASLPIEDPRRFTSLPDDVRARIKDASAEHAKKLNDRLQKKEEHHRKVAVALKMKADRLAAKAAHQQHKAARMAEKASDLKKAKLIDDDDEQEEKDSDKNNNVVFPVSAQAVFDAEAMWARVPRHVKERIVSRWLASSVGINVESFSTFEKLPQHVQARIRARAEHHIGKFGNKFTAPHPPATEFAFANPAFQSAPAPTSLPIPNLDKK
jgi:hypothetical protein